MKMQTLIPLAKKYRREEDFSADLAKDISVLNLGTYDDAETEAWVGTRKADIVARNTDDLLVVENQFGKADWDHWGRLEAYSRIKGANVAALVAEEFEELMIVTCNLRNQDSDIDWYLIKAYVNDRDEHSFHHVARPDIDIQSERKGVEYSEFWAPIREKGLFSGKPVPVSNDGWISKSIRGINISLWLTKGRSGIGLGLQGENRVERRDKLAEFMASEGYNFNKSDSAKFSNLTLELLDKGKNDIGSWEEIRESMLRTGTAIYELLLKSKI